MNLNKPQPDALLHALLNSEPPAPRLSEIGKVTEVGDGIAVVTGLARALADELLQFASGVRGIIFDLEPNRLGVILLGKSDRVSVGEDVMRTRQVVSVPVGASLLGRVVDALGRPRDGKGRIEVMSERPVESDAPAILHRSAITRPLATGIKAIDAAVPVGLGQRELIIGDRQTGKTSIAVDTILNQVTLRCDLHLLRHRTTRRRRCQSDRGHKRRRYDAKHHRNVRRRRGPSGPLLHRALRGHDDGRIFCGQRA